MADLPHRVRPTLRCLRHDLNLPVGPTDDPLDEIDHPLLAKANEQFTNPATPHERIAALDDLWGTKTPAQSLNREKW